MITIIALRGEARPGHQGGKQGGPLPGPSSPIGSPSGRKARRQQKDPPPFFKMYLFIYVLILPWAAAQPEGRCWPIANLTSYAPSWSGQLPGPWEGVCMLRSGFFFFHCTLGRSRTQNFCLVKLFFLQQGLCAHRSFYQMSKSKSALFAKYVHIQRIVFDLVCTRGV